MVATLLAFHCGKPVWLTSHANIGVMMAKAVNMSRFNIAIADTPMRLPHGISKTKYTAQANTPMSIIKSPRLKLKDTNTCHWPELIKYNKPTAAMPKPSHEAGLGHCFKIKPEVMKVAKGMQVLSREMLIAVV